MNKQIEEMAKDICHLPCTCDECTYPKYRKNIDKCKAKVYAERAYKKGYRKQSEGEWRSEYQERPDWKGKMRQYYFPDCCSVCHEPVENRTNYCPNCGAKMKGDKTDA